MPVRVCLGLGVSRNPDPSMPGTCMPVRVCLGLGVSRNPDPSMPGTCMPVRVCLGLGVSRNPDPEYAKIRLSPITRGDLEQSCDIVSKYSPGGKLPIEAC